MAGIGATVALIKALAPKADPAVIQKAVEDYLEAHPEISVADGSITEEKLAADVAGILDDLQDDVTDVKTAIQGVEDELKTVTETSEEIEDISFTSGYGIIANQNDNRYGNRAEGNSSTKYCGFVNIEKYKKIDITMLKYKNASDFGIVFYSSASSSTPVAGYTINSGAESMYVETRTFDIPQGAKYFRSTFYAGYDFECIGYWDEEVKAIEKIEGNIGSLDQLETDEKEDLVSAINEVNQKASAIVDFTEDVPVTFNSGFIIIANSQDGNYGNRYSTGNVNLASNFINIEKYNKIEITMPKYVNATDAGIVFYSGESSSTPVAGYVINSGASAMTTETRIFDIPEGAKYFRTTYRTDLDEFSCIGHYSVDVGGLGDVYLKALKNEKKINDIENEDKGINIAVKVNDFDDGVMTDDQIITAALAFISNCENKTIIFDGRDWIISQAILLESNTTVIIDGVKIKQADGTFDNVFRGKNFVVDQEYPNQFAASVSDTENIRIIGLNGAKVEGPDVNATIYNPYLQETVPAVGDEYGWRAFQIYFCNCDGIEISGLTITKTRNWAISFEFCKNGNIHDLIFNTAGVKNGDGIDLRIGCHHFKIHDIYGITKDDTIACTCLYPAYSNASYPSQTSDSMFPCVASRTGQSLENVSQRDLDIHDVWISNIFTGGEEHAVICLCNNGLRVYNVIIDNVKEKEQSARGSVVEIYNGYGSSWHQGSYSAGDLNSISAGDIEANGANYALRITCTVADVYLNKLVQKIAGKDIYSISNMSGVTITNTEANP